jgi:gamma-glutamylaminecyclotransferase
VSAASAPAAHVFVYGTLKRGGANHAHLAGQTFVATARTTAGLTLYSLGEYPGLVAVPSDTDGVTGELWAVDAACLARLDILEGVAEGLYAREPAPLSPPHERLTPSAQLYRYLGPVDGCPHLGSRWAE